ncbi:MAG: hypothetical protein AAF234_05880 [Pseudomonadota bacterium]
MPIPGITTEQLRTIVWPLFMVEADGKKTPIGSATVIGAFGAHALLITAGHILQYAERVDDPRQWHHSSALQFFLPERSRNREWRQMSLHVMAGDETGNFAVCDVTHVGHSKSTDAAILFVDVPEGVDHRISTSLPIRSRGPLLDEKIYTVGYFDISDVTQKHWPPFLPKEILAPDLAFFDGRITHLDGTVLDVFEEGEALNRWPCFKVSTPFHSGMSGGAILSIAKDGALVLSGVISSDASTKEGQEKYGSGENAIASKIYPVLGLRFGEALTYEYEENESLVSEKKERLLDFLDGEAVVDIDHAQDHLQVEIKSNGYLQYSWT